jgi:hypothetical protein
MATGESRQKMGGYTPGKQPQRFTLAEEGQYKAVAVSKGASWARKTPAHYPYNRVTFKLMDKDTGEEIIDKRTSKPLTASALVSAHPVAWAILGDMAFAGNYPEELEEFEAPEDVNDPVIEEHMVPQFDTVADYLIESGVVVNVEVTHSSQGGNTYANLKFLPPDEVEVGGATELDAEVDDTEPEPEPVKPTPKKGAATAKPAGGASRATGTDKKAARKK